MASGWNLWVWLECIGVISGCCKEVLILDILIIIITFPYSTCIIIIALFGSSIPTFLFILKMFFYFFIASGCELASVVS